MQVKLTWQEKPHVGEKNLQPSSSCENRAVEENLLPLGTTFLGQNSVLMPSNGCSRDVTGPVLDCAIFAIFINFSFSRHFFLDLALFSFKNHTTLNLTCLDRTYWSFH
jgi:hypothetical protein